MKFPITLALGAISLTGCGAWRQAPVSDYGYEEPYSDYAATGPCDGPLERVSQATYGGQAEVELRKWLHCLAESQSPPPVDLRGAVSEQLERNPFPAIARDRQAILDRFFEKDQLKDLPANLREMDTYVMVLEDQALVARAQGDVDFADAARARAQRVRTLLEILEEIEG
jgi:hypothetical protein